MNIWLSIFTVAITYTIMVVTPGPNFLVIVKNSLAHSRQVGFYTAVGIAVGTVIHTTAGFIGLTVILSQLGWLFNLIKLLGSVYLIYLGYKALRAKKRALEASPADQHDIMGKTKALRSGLLTCLSNPKSALFYLSLFTVIIPPTSPVWAQLVMGLIMIGLSLGWYGSVAFLFSQSTIQKLYARLERWLNYLVGGLLIALGLRIALARD